MKKIFLAALLLINMPLCAISLSHKIWSIIKGLFKTTTGFLLLTAGAPILFEGIDGFSLRNSTDEQIREKVKKEVVDGILRINRIMNEKKIVKDHRYINSATGISLVAGALSLFNGAYKDFKDVLD